MSFSLLLLLAWAAFGLMPPGPKAPHKISLMAPGDTVKGVTYRLKGSLIAGDTVVAVFKRSGPTTADTVKTRSTTTANLGTARWIMPPAAGATDTVSACVVVTRPNADPSPAACASKVRKIPLPGHPGVEGIEIVPASLTLSGGGVATTCAFLRWSDGVGTRTTPYNSGCETAWQTWRAPFRPSREQSAS